MIEWALRTKRTLPDEITYIKHGPCRELPVRSRSLENADPIEGIQEENVCIEHIPG